MPRRIRRLPRCQHRGCSELVSRSVRIDLPATWPGIELPETRVYVGLCPRCAREVEGRLRGMAELPALLMEAEGAIAYLRERATGAEQDARVTGRALMQLLRAVGSEVADELDLRLALGLPA